MPIDKLGRHFLTTAPYNFPWRQQYDLQYICQPSIKSECVLKISSSDQQVSSHIVSSIVTTKAPTDSSSKPPDENQLKYLLDNHKTFYKFPIEGRVKAITLFPEDTKIVLNNSRNSHPNWTLLEKQVKKGDTLSFYATTIPKLKERLYVELVLHCPLIKEDEY